MPPRDGKSTRTTARSGYVILLSPVTAIRSSEVGAPSINAVCTGPAVWVAQLPIWPVPKSRKPRQLYGTYQELNGRYSAAPSQSSQSRLDGIGSVGGGSFRPVG